MAKDYFGGNEVENLMAKIRHLSEIQQAIAFSEFDFYQRYAETFNAFNEGTRLRHCISLAQKLIGVPVKKVGGDQGYSGNDNRTFCKDNHIETSFTQKGKAGTNEVKNATKRELARVRATAMEGSFGTQKEHYGLRKIAARIKSTEIMLIFFGIHTANVVNLARRDSIQLPLTA